MQQNISLCIGIQLQCICLRCTLRILVKLISPSKFWGFHGNVYEECRLLGYKIPVRTSQETHYVSVTESSQLMLCKIWGFHGGDYEECRLLGYKNPIRTSQETHHVYTTEPSQLMLCKIWGFHGGHYEECRLLGYKNPVRTSQETQYFIATESSQLMLCKIWGFHGGDYDECRLLGYKIPYPRCELGTLRDCPVWRRVTDPPPWPCQSWGGGGRGRPVSGGLTGPPCSWGYECGDPDLQVGWVSNEAVIYGNWPFATLTCEWCALQNTDPSFRQRGRPT
jgi:hypothetical protein